MFEDIYYFHDGFYSRLELSHIALFLSAYQMHPSASNIPKASNKYLTLPDPKVNSFKINLDQLLKLAVKSFEFSHNIK